MAAHIVRADGSTFRFDAVTRITYSPSVTVTDHPVEDGSVVSDHAQRQPLLVSLNAIVSASPFASVASSGGAERLRAALAFLDAIAEERVSLVDDRLGTFDNLQITRWPHTVDALLRLELPIEFKQVRIATAGTVTLPGSSSSGVAPISDRDAALLTTILNNAAAAQALVATNGQFASTQDVGAQATGTTANDAAAEEADASTLYSLLYGA